MFITDIPDAPRQDVPIVITRKELSSLTVRAAHATLASFHAHVRKGIYPIDWAGNASDKEQYGEQAGNKQPIAFAA